MTLLVGPKDGFSEALAYRLDLKFIELGLRTFPDGELCPRVLVKDVGEVAGKDVVFVCRIRVGGRDPNEYLVNYLLSLMNLKFMGVRRVKAVMPYFIYSRQDDVFRPGEPLSAKFVASLIEGAGADEFYTVTAHLHRRRSIGECFEKAKAFNASGIKALASWVKGSYELKDPFILSPDAEAVTWAEEFSRIVEASEYDALIKERDLATGAIKTMEKAFRLRGRDLIIVDDIVSTGGTMINAVSIARKHEPRRIFCCFVHPILADGALEKIRSLKVDDIIATDTIPSEVSKVSVVELLAETLKKEGKLI